MEVLLHRLTLQRLNVLISRAADELSYDIQLLDVYKYGR